MQGFSRIAALGIKHARTICVAICAGYFVVGLWPFNFCPHNGVEWPAAEKGLRFKPPSTVTSDVLLGPAASISIELFLKPELEKSGSTFPVLSLFDGRLPESLLVTQWKSELLLRTAMVSPGGRRRYRETALAGAMHRGSPRFITITAGPGGTLFYVDGNLARAYPRSVPNPDSIRGRLILGNSADGRACWTGILFGLAIYDFTLDPVDVHRHHELWTAHRQGEIAIESGVTGLYFFDEGKGNALIDHSPIRNSLGIPERYHAIRKTVLSPPWKGLRFDPSSLEDIVVNIFGFVPFGFFYYLFRRDRCQGRKLRHAAMTLFVAGMLSLSIELAQVYLPTRSSSLTDLICNVAGAWGGVLLVRLVDWPRAETSSTSLTIPPSI